MLKGKNTAAFVAARPILKKLAATAIAAFFYGIVLLNDQKAEAGPAVFVEKTIAAQQTSIFISGSGLPEMRRITFSCTYSVPRASIMDAIVSSPQPATAISVLVDTAASSLSVSISATSTILLPDNARMVVLKMNNPSTGGVWPITVVKALMIDKQGASSEIPVTVKASIIGNVTPIAGYGRMQFRNVSGTFFEINGRKVSGCIGRATPGYYLKSIGSAGTVATLVVR